MRWIGFIVAMTIFTGFTGYGLLASTAGWGLPGPMEKPVSIRQASTQRRRGSGPMFIYFGSRRHYGGGYRGGK